MPIPLTSSPHGVAFAVRVVPRAGQSGVAGIRGDALLVRLAAAPVEGAANDALISLLARLFDRPKRDIIIVSGQSSRSKRIAVAGARPEAVSARLSAILAASGRSK